MLGGVLISLIISRSLSSTFQIALMLCHYGTKESIIINNIIICALGSLAYWTSTISLQVQPLGLVVHSNQEIRVQYVIQLGRNY